MAPAIVAVPIFFLFRNVGLLDSIWALMIIYAAINLSLVTWIIRSYMLDIPKELEDAARTDGASDLRILWEIIIPAILPGIITASVIAMIFAINEFLFTLLIASTPNAYTMSVALANFTGGSETQVGDATANALTANKGASSIDILIGGQNDDTLTSDGGLDVLYGGEGNDTLIVTGSEFQRVAGGTGVDTLSLSGSSITLDLTTIADNRIVDVEVIDITGSGSNSLMLDFLEVVNISSSSNTLRVIGQADDSVAIDAEWTEQAISMIDGTNHRVFSQGTAILQVAELVKVTEAILVNSTLDKVDQNPGNGTVDTGTTGEITLRAAIMEANALSGDVAILVPL